MNVDELRAIVSDWFTDHAAQFGLDPHTLIVEYVLNQGGFVNYSWRIRDASLAYHLKLSASADDRAALRQWLNLSPRLERYHAPPILKWVDVGVAAGLLFPHIAGSPPTLDDIVIEELVPMLGQLNADRELAAALRTSHTMTARAEYLSSLHRRFTEDLIAIHESRPPFVGDDVLVWMDREVMRLEASIASCAAFDEPLTKPIHGDLWLNNVLWSGRNDWYVVDWDDLRIGDPAVDMATLLGPTADDLRPLKLLDRVEGALTATEYERLNHLGRATLLDWVIDPLADWIEARIAPAHAESVRAEKERVHKRALEWYRELYA